jgi:mono/diheme cytochrome c family protein
LPKRSGRISAYAVTLGLLYSTLQISPAAAEGFTAAQAEAGKTLYESNCAQCHGFKLEGPDAPGLVGADVMSNWSTAGGLHDFIAVAMPPSAPGQLGEETYLNIIAYIMSFNGIAPGDKPLTSDPELLASVSLTQAPTAAVAAPDAGGAPASGTAVDVTPVPQAFTWGKQLPGGSAPAATTPAASSEPAVPQAYTWGKQLPTVAK